MNKNEILEKVKAYYALPENGVGGNLHIVLDDGNIEVRNIEFCKELCIKERDKEGLELCDILLSASKTQRNFVYNSSKL